MAESRALRTFPVEGEGTAATSPGYAKEPRQRTDARHAEGQVDRAVHPEAQGGGGTPGPVTSTAAPTAPAGRAAGAAPGDLAATTDLT